MDQLKNVPKSASQYFNRLMKNLQPEDQKLDEFEEEQVLPMQYYTRQIEQEAYFNILDNVIEFKQTPDSVQQIITLPRGKGAPKDIDEIDRKIKQNQEQLRQAKREMLLQKRHQQEVMKLEQEIKMRQNEQRTRQWAQRQKNYEKRRKQLAQKRQKSLFEDMQRQKLERQRQKQQQFQQRRQSLHERMKLLQLERQRRRELFERALQQSKRIPAPKFKQMQKEFQKYVKERDLEKQEMKRSLKQLKEVDFEQIKQHQKKYIDKLQERLRQKGYSSLKSMKQQDRQLQQSRYKILLKRSDEQIQEERQRFKRRLSYQTRLQQIQLNIDEEKKMKIEIARDKARNPLKYNFLRQKQLNDYQIFTQFKDFAIDIDRNQLGKQYLKEARKMGEQSRIRKSQSVSAFGIKQNDRQNTQERYKNYLPQIKARRSANEQTAKISLNNPLTERMIQEVVKKVGSKQKALEKISKSLKKYDDTILNKKLQLKSLNMLSSTIRKQKQIDELYMKGLKAKLACLQISD